MPSAIEADFDLSSLPDDYVERVPHGVSVWRGIWYPFITTS